MPLDLTIAIPVKNEAHQILACLNAIGNNFATQVVIIDSNSTDNTITIAQNWGAATIQFNWDGKYPKKRNWYLLNHTPQTKWVLFLDADEILTAQFKTKLSHILNQTENAGFWLNYSIYMDNYQLKAGYPLKKLALFQTKKGLYEKIEEDNWSNLDMEIHEHPIINGSVGFISEKIDHKVNFKHPNWKAKHIEYAKWEAKRWAKLRLDKNVSHSLTNFQKTKYLIVQTPIAGIMFFLGSYIGLLGFMDGTKGLKYAWLKAFYFNQVYKEIKKIKN